MKKNQHSRERDGEDLSRWAARYRARLEAEGRVNSMKILDKAMRDDAVPDEIGDRGKK